MENVVKISVFVSLSLCVNSLVGLVGRPVAKNASCPSSINYSRMVMNAKGGEGEGLDSVTRKMKRYFPIYGE